MSDAEQQQDVEQFWEDYARRTPQSSRLKVYGLEIVRLLLTVGLSLAFLSIWQDIQSRKAIIDVAGLVRDEIKSLVEELKI